MRLPLFRLTCPTPEGRPVVSSLSSRLQAVPSIDEGSYLGPPLVIQSLAGFTVLVVPRLSAIALYPSWRTTMDQTLSVSQVRGETP